MGYDSSPSMCKFLDFPLLGSKFTKFLIPFFKQKASYSSKFESFFSARRDNSWNFTATDKSSTSKCKFSDLPLLALKFTKFLMLFLEPRVSFSSNFASLFSVMKHNFSVLFHLNLYMLWIKGSKYIMFELKKYRGVTFGGIKYWYKIWWKTDLCFQKWHEQFSKFPPQHVRKSENWDFDRILLSKVENLWA